MTARTVPVALGDRRYDILIGTGLARAADDLRAAIGRGQPAVVADGDVWARHGKAFTAAFGEMPLIEVAPGERSKDFATYQRVTEELLAVGVGRDGTVIAFGGGVVGDLAGFCAATLRRGCRFVQVPTTLLAQVDSSVGGKVAINAAAGKNLVGAFHQPRLVIADMGLLRTLPDREMRAGYAEIVKYGLLGDADFFAWLEERGPAVLSHDPDALAQAVERSCVHKARVVAADEREAGERALLNLGHTFGHALEAAAGYDGSLLHGEGVAIGMAMAFRYAAVRGMAPARDVARVEAHLAAAGLPSRPADIPGLRTTPDEQLAFMYQDKKAMAGTLTLISVRGIGEAFVEREAEPGPLLDFLKGEFESVPS